jgi:hypothetical protein
LKNYKGSPYQDSRRQSGAQKIPGRVECAYYDRGGEGVAYHDVDAKNDGSGGLNPAGGTYLNQFRMDEGVELSNTKSHDQIDNSPYDLVQPPENQLHVGRLSPENGSASQCRLHTRCLPRRSPVHLESGRNDFNGCEGRDWAAANRLYLQCLRFRCLATVA